MWVQETQESGLAQKKRGRKGNAACKSSSNSSSSNKGDSEVAAANDVTHLLELLQQLMEAAKRLTQCEGNYKP